MKKRIFIFVLLAGILQNNYAQFVVDLNVHYYYTFIPICNGDTIEVAILNTSDPLALDAESALISAASDAFFNPNGQYYYLVSPLNAAGIDFISPGTYKYNCHAYAWHMNRFGGEPFVWIRTGYNNLNLSKYWAYTDGCFIQVDESDAEVVHYYMAEGGHSALVDPNNPGMYLSKWGHFPVFRHAPDNVPSDYDSYYRRYYRSVHSIAVEGPPIVLVNGQATYTLSAGNAHQWALSNSRGNASYASTSLNGFSLSSPHDSTSVTITASGNIIGNVFLISKLNGWYWASTNEIKAGYHVSFSLNGAPGTPPSQQVVARNDKANKPADPSWSGHTFCGWYTNTIGTGNPVNFDTPITSNQTYYAKWEPVGTTGIDVIIHNQTSCLLEGTYICLTGNVGGSGYVFMSLDLNDLPSGNNVSGDGNNYIATPNMAITNLQVTFSASFCAPGYYTVVASVTSAGLLSKSINSGWNEFVFNIPNSTVPTSGRRILEITIY